MKLYKDKYYLALSFAAALVSFILYNLTKAPTVSFWDCGEFIATSYIMGIPHPPGNPLFVIIGRLFTMLPIASSLAVRVNLISVVSSAAAVWVAFWLILKLSIGNRETAPEGYSRIGLGAGAFCGALVMGFGTTFWSNAVEAEVYGLAMLLMLIITYVAITWAQSQDEPGNDRKLILISYLLWLSLGIHITTFILAMPIVFYMAWVDFKHSSLARWPIWITMALYVLYAVPIQTQILSLVGYNNNATELESFIVIMGAVLIGAITMTVISLRKAHENSRVWILTLMVLFSGVVGYSTQAYIPIRAAEKPAINENDPSNWPRFKNFLERKQYGQESMITRMFTRRGSFESQFISNPDFGLFRLLSEQFASPNARLNLFKSGDESKGNLISFGFSLWILYIVFFGIGGIIESFKRSQIEGVFITLTMLLCTVGLVYYLNFSDGTYNKLIAPQAEVRNRDYFYTPGFMYFGILIGIGMAAALEWAGKRASSALNYKTWYKAGFAIMIIGVLLLTAHTARAGYSRNNRAGNYTPWNYANNLLQSCAPNSILFTNGDNDTFPLWYLQEVEKVRTDIRVVNLSLLNTPWYIHQIKEQRNVPIFLTYAEIENLRAYRMQDGGIWRIQDEMVKQIIMNSQSAGWNPPLFFAMTVPDENTLGIDDHFVLEGMVYRVVESSGKGRINTSVGWRIFGNPSNFRGLGDPKVRKDDNDQRLASNYVSAMFQIVEAELQHGQIDSAITMAEMAVGLNPPEYMWQSRGYLIKLYALNDKLNKIEPVISTVSAPTGEKVLLAVGQDCLTNKAMEPAEYIFSLALRRFPYSFPALNNLVLIYYQKGDSVSAEKAIAKFKGDNSRDATLMNSVDDLINRMKSAPAGISEAK
jgi:hypothetical protein